MSYYASDNLSRMYTNCNFLKGKNKTIRTMENAITFKANSPVENKLFYRKEQMKSSIAFLVVTI